MLYTSEELLKQVNETLDNLVYDRRPMSLYDPIKYVLSLGGKRIRPVMTLLSYNLYREDPWRIISQAIGLETYHNFTLLHDDLMDRADLRRGHQTVHKRWNDNQAILSGDTMLLQAFQRMLDCDVKVVKQVMDLFIITTLEIGEGQQLDMEFEDREDVTEDEYIEMIRLKTSVLIACALKMGGLLAGASQSDINALYSLGEKIGLAFQLQDDLLDVYGDPKIFGKKIGGDIACNKKTYMLINAYYLAESVQRAKLERWIKAETFDRDEKVAAVTAIYDEIGIRQLCEEKINFYYEQGLRYLSQLSVPEDRKTQLRRYIAEMMERQV